VYVGGPGFGARRGAGNAVEDIAALVRYARPFGVRVYATMNILLMENELDEARRTALSLVDAGVDALIVQDMAFLRMGFEGVELHASTQTANIDPAEVTFLGRAGFRRAILERALSGEDIRAIRRAAPKGLELEAFVHGAICVSYSGRCFMSRAMDGVRSGNRGDCVQSCRLPWDLVNGEGQTVLKGKHLLSLRDLDLSPHIGELLDAGVSSFKIEGRLKDAAYVRNIVSHYRRRLDAELARRPHLVRASVGASVPDFEPDPARSFTRGATDYFFRGATPGLRVASMDTPKAMGERIGRVVQTGCERTGNRYFTLEGGAEARHTLAPGDGICYMAGGELRGTAVGRVEGGRVYPGRGDGLEAGTEIFRNHNHTFVRTMERSRMRRRIAAGARMEVAETEATVTYTDETGVSAVATRTGEFAPARDAAKMAATLRDELSRSGDTLFDVRKVESRGGGARFVPLSMLAAMRREGLERLLEARTALPPLRQPAEEDPAAKFPRTELTTTENVTNSLAERFWRDHGVTEIPPPLELRAACAGDTLMRMRYCLRREIGQCLRERPTLTGDLYIVRGAMRHALEFDCAKCEMTVRKI
jgi:putative protease